MSSGLWPPGTVCCICFRGILEPVGHARDLTGQKWDVCAGICADQAGIVELHPVTVAGATPEYLVAHYAGTFPED